MLNEICKLDPPLWNGSTLKITDKETNLISFECFSRWFLYVNLMVLLILYILIACFVSFCTIMQITYREMLF